MKVKPYRFNVEAWFSKDLPKDDKYEPHIIVNIDMDSKGKLTINPSITSTDYAAGSLRATPGQLPILNEFMGECLESFKEMVKVSEAIFIEPKKEKKNAT